MSSILLSVTLMLSSVFAYAAVFPDGEYSGKGTAKHPNGTSFNYTLDLSIRNLKWKYKYVYPGNRVVTYELMDAPTPSGFFTMTMNGVQVAEGYCGEKQCRTRMEFPSTKQKIDINSLYLDDAIYTLGENITTGYFFEEALKRVADSN